MQFEKNTSRAKSKTFLVKVILISVIIISVVIMLGKIDFPSPNKEIKKNIPNENLKIVK